MVVQWIMSAPAGELEKSGAYPINAIHGDVSFVEKYGRSPFSYDSDPLRIRVHLEYVIERLRAKDVSQVAVGVRELREQLLNVLHAYAQAGNFPQNVEKACRTPIFIDSHGTPCAVAKLIQASGHPSLADKLDSNFHHAYLSDICGHDSNLVNELNNWASSHGFDLDELAAIQPGYTPSDVAKLVMLVVFVWMFAIHLVLTITFSIIAAFVQWPCASTIQFIIGGALSIVSLLLFAVGLVVDERYVCVKDCLRIAFLLVLVLTGVNSFVGLIVLSTPVCKASAGSLIFSWMFFLAPMILAPAVMVIYNKCSYQSWSSRHSKRRRRNNMSNQETGWFHGGLTCCRRKKREEKNQEISWTPIGTNLTTFSHPQPMFAAPGNAVVASYPQLAPSAFGTAPMQSHGVAFQDPRFSSRINYTPPPMMKMLSFSAGKAFGFQDPATRLAMDTASTSSGSDSTLSDEDIY